MLDLYWSYRSFQFYLTVLTCPTSTTNSLLVSFSELLFFIIFCWIVCTLRFFLCLFVCAYFIYYMFIEALQGWKCPPGGSIVLCFANVCKSYTHMKKKKTEIWLFSFLGVKLGKFRKCLFSHFRPRNFFKNDSIDIVFSPEVANHLMLQQFRKFQFHSSYKV